jgi:hypothetical protein
MDLSGMVIFGMVSVGSNSFVGPRMLFALLGTLFLEVHENSITAFLKVFRALECNYLKRIFQMAIMIPSRCPMEL